MGTATNVSGQTITVTVAYVVVAAQPPNVPGGVAVGSGQTIGTFVLQPGQSVSWPGGVGTTSGPLFPLNTITSETTINPDTIADLGARAAARAALGIPPGFAQLPPPVPIQVVTSQLQVTGAPANAVQVSS